MEAVPPSWGRCDFGCFANFLIQYLGVHQRASSEARKPLILEEYGAIMP
jgi:mannan endo-1,4-beta-mannosidase